MHIPDGFLDTRTWLLLDFLSAAFVVLSLERVRNNLGEKKIPLLGVIASFIFAAQLLNFPLIGGASGHLIGGALSAILLGPWASILVMATVSLIQCLLFQEGGFTALGANIFNMGILSSLFGFPIFCIVKKMVGGDRGIYVGAFVSAWLSVILASAGCALVLSISGVAPIHFILPFLVGVYTIIGLGEAFITAIVVKLVLQSRPDLIKFASLESERIG